MEEPFRRRLRAYLIGAETLTPAAYQSIERKHNERVIQTVLSDFRVSRECQVQLLTALQRKDFERTAWHPRLRTLMRLVDYLPFVAEHDDHHLARIWAVACSVGTSNAVTTIQFSGATTTVRAMAIGAYAWRKIPISLIGTGLGQDYDGTG